MPTPTSIETVVLDLDDTLIVEEATAHASLRAAAVHLTGLDPQILCTAVLAEARRLWRAGPHWATCTELGFASWEGLWSTFEGGHPRLDGLRDWSPAYRLDTWRSCLRNWGMHDEPRVRACGEEFVAQQRLGHPLIDGAVPAVRQLAQRYRLAPLTNGPPDIQRHKLEMTGLADCFEAVVVSGEVGVAKPGAAVFAMVTEELDARPSTTVMVGDNWDRDVLGARNAGWSAIWVADGRPLPDSDRGVPSVTSVSEVPDLLSRTMEPMSDAPVPGRAAHPKVKS